MVGATVAAAEFLPIFLALPLGTVVDVVGPKVLTQIGIATLIVASIMRVVASGIPMLLAAQIMVGLSSLLVFLCIQSYVVLLSKPTEQARNFGIWSFTASSGMLVGPILGGGLAELALEWRGEGLFAYRTVFFASIVLSAISALTARALPVVVGQNPHRLSLYRISAEARNLLRNHYLAVGTWSSFALTLSSEIRRSFFPVYLASLTLPSYVIGLLFSAHSLASLLGRPYLGWLSQYFGSVRVLAGSLLLCVVGWGLIPLGRSAWAIFFLTVLAGLGGGIGSTITMVMIGAGSQPGLGMGLRQTANRSGNFLAPLAFGAAAGLMGLNASFFLAAGFALGGFVTVLAISRHSSLNVRNNQRPP